MEYKDPGTANPSLAAREQYSPGMAVGNPQSFPKSSVDEVYAEGFSTSSVQESAATGHGDWSEGAWRLVIVRPLLREGGSSFAPGAATFAAFAVWQGGRDEVGARKRAVHPEKVPQRIVLRMRPCLAGLLKSRAIEPDMRAAHRVGPIRPSLDNVRQAMPVSGKEPHQGRHDSHRGARAAIDIQSMTEVDVIPHPDMLVSALQIRAGQDGGRKQARAERDKAEGAVAFEESSQPFYAPEIVAVAQVRQQLFVLDHERRHVQESATAEPMRGECTRRRNRHQAEDGTGEPPRTTWPASVRSPHLRPGPGVVFGQRRAWHRAHFRSCR